MVTVYAPPPYLPSQTPDSADGRFSRARLYWQGKAAGEAHLHCIYVSMLPSNGDPRQVATSWPRRPFGRLRASRFACFVIEVSQVSTTEKQQTRYNF